MKEITVYPARKVITMDPGRPFAEAVAVTDGRVLSTGTIESMQPWLERYPHKIDDVFRDAVIMPGLIDPHTHFTHSAGYLALHYIGPIPSPGPNGINPPLLTRQEVIDKLKAAHAAEKDPTSPILAWGLDPAAQGGNLHRDELDQISRTRPIFCISYAPHFTYLNSAALTHSNVTESTNVHGVQRYPDGRLSGVFVEIEANRLALGGMRGLLAKLGGAEGLRRMGRIAQAAGVTTSAELIFGMGDFEIEWSMYSSTVNEESYPLRMGLVTLENAIHHNHGAKAVDFLLSVMPRNNDKLFFHGVKFLSDGSFPAMSLRVNFPGYLDGSNGLRNDIPWEELPERGDRRLAQCARPAAGHPAALRPSLHAGALLHQPAGPGAAAEGAGRRGERQQLLRALPQPAARPPGVRSRPVGGRGAARLARARGRDLRAALGLFAGAGPDASADRGLGRRQSHRARRQDRAGAGRADRARAGAARHHHRRRLRARPRRQARQPRAGQIRGFRDPEGRPLRRRREAAQGHCDLGHGPGRPAAAGVTRGRKDAMARPPQLAPLDAGFTLLTGLMDAARIIPARLKAKDNSLPLTILAGFLGAGKTTLVNRLLSAPEGRRIVVLVNDFGSLDIDARLISSRSPGTISLANGCACCTVAGDLSRALVELAQRSDPPDAILLEASGLADPLGIAQVALANPAVRLDGIVTMIDAETASHHARE